LTLTLEQLKLAFDAFKSFRLTASQDLFSKMFGEDVSEQYWFKFTDHYNCDIIGFWGYLDDAYKEVLLTYLLHEVVPRLDKCVQINKDGKTE